MVFCYVNSSKWGKNRLEHGGGANKNIKKRQKYFLQIISSLLDHVTPLKSQINLYPCILYGWVTAIIRFILFKNYCFHWKNKV